MRCLSCDRNQSYRSGMVCECGYRFVLSPKEAPFLADRAFVRAIALASEDWKKPYTVEQLHATIFRRRNRHWWNRLVLAPATNDLAATRGAIGCWKGASRHLGPMLTEPALELAGSAVWPEKDLYDYGAEGVVLVGRPTLVDLLIAHGLHTTAKVVIVAPGFRYPAGVLNRASALLAARPDLPLFLLHDSGPGAAEELAEHARTAVPLDGRSVTDLGLGEDVATLHPSMRWTRRYRRVPVDFLHPRLLTAGLAAAIAERRPLDALLDRDASDGDASAWWFALDGDFG